MDIPALVKGLIATFVIPQVGGMRTPIVLLPQVGRNRYGPIYGDPIDHVALVENATETVASADGTARVSTSKFTFFEQIEIHEGDRILLNGVETTVIKISGLLDPDGIPYLPEAWTGK